MTDTTRKARVRPPAERKGDRQVVEIVRKDYQPSKSELEAEVSLHNIPGDTIHERARNLAKALIQPVSIKYVRRPKPEK